MRPGFFSLPEFLIERFPAWKEELEADYAFWCESNIQPYPHTFLENYLLQEILTATREGASERAAFAFQILEELLAAEDGDLAEAALLSVVEPLATHPELFESAARFMGPLAAERAEWLRAPG